jgi:Ni/Fe-hydrogenase 1 B-type cytochrome subunit
MENLNQLTSSEKSPFLQSHSATIRIWHWVSFILISLIIVTVLLNTTLLNPRKNAGQVQSQLKEQGITITERQSFFVAHQFDDKLWDLHRLLGIGVAIMLVFRILSELLMPKDERIRTRVKSALNLFRSGSVDKAGYRHYLIVKYSYFLFYILIFYMALTGLTLAFERQLGLPGQINHTIKELHGAGQWVMYAFVLFHLGGVILADLGKAKGVVSGMINGNK